jgi:hypothetical protein
MTRQYIYLTSSEPETTSFIKNNNENNFKQIGNTLQETGDAPF